MQTLLPDGYTDPEAADTHIPSSKLLSETALLLLCTAGVAQTDPAVRQQLYDVAQALIPHARNQRILTLSYLQPSRARDYTFAHACLSRIGYPDSVFDRQIGLTLSAETAYSVERLPHRELEQLWLKRLWPIGASSNAKGELSIASHSMLGRQLDALSATRDDLYAFTHAIMYLTDVGSRVARLPRSLAAIVADAEAALGWCLDDEDYDVAGEVLLAWPYLRQTWSASAVFGLLVLTQIEDEVTFLPSQGTRIEHYLTLDSGERARYALASAYHTIYVMGLLCAACLRLDGEVVRVIPSRHERGSAEALLEVLDDQSCTEHWRRFVEALSPDEQDSIAPLLLTIALRRGFKRRDFSSLRHALEIGVAFHLVSSLPAARQAGQLLRRSAQFEQQWQT